MRVCFTLAYPGYLRYFDSVLAELHERGHAVDVYVHSPGKQPEGLRALDQIEGVRYGGHAWKSRPRSSAVVARDLRRTADYVRYLHPEFRESHYYRDRTRSHVPPGFQWVTKFNTLPGPVVDAALAVLKALDEAAPLDTSFDAFLDQAEPDLLVVSPLLMPGSVQPDLARAAQQRRIPVVAAVASWDHLTTKGLLRPQTDRVLVWNDAQRSEAIRLHGTDSRRIVVTGAQPFDRWFSRTPKRDADAFRQRVGLPAGSPFVLFVGSTASISHPEAEVAFVRRWIHALRTGPHSVRDLAVLVRPHPYNADAWSPEVVADLERTAIWPIGGSNPVDDADRDDYFDSLYHASAVVGVNTTAMVEAAILDKPVLSIERPDFEETQRGSLHYRHMLVEHGGFLATAKDFDAHLEQLEHVLGPGSEALAEARHRFVTSFIRPGPAEVPATARAADAIEDAASRRLPPPRPPSAVARGGARVVILLLALHKTVRDPAEAPAVTSPASAAIARAGRTVKTRGGRFAKRLERRGMRRGGATARVATQQLTEALMSTARSSDAFFHNRADKARHTIPKEAA